MKRSTIAVKPSRRGLTVAALSFMLALASPMGATAGEAEAKSLLKAMSDHLAAQQALSFAYDATLEVVTQDEQKLALASSGSVVLTRPDKIRATRTGGFADVEMSFDGTSLTILGKNLNVYAQRQIPGTVDNLIDELRETYNRPLPAADLLLSDAYSAMMEEVVDIKDLGSGVIGGVECDHLAFRKKDVDYQIWIAQGSSPYPCRFVITSKFLATSPQYTIQTSDWQFGDQVEAVAFEFQNPTMAEKVEPENLKGVDELPDHFTIGASK